MPRGTESLASVTWGLLWPGWMSPGRGGAVFECSLRALCVSGPVLCAPPPLCPLTLR